MSLYSNVAPKRRVREKPGQWQCACKSHGLAVDRQGHIVVTEPDFRYVSGWHPGWLSRCSDCGTKRP